MKLYYIEGVYPFERELFVAAESSAAAYRKWVAYYLSNARYTLEGEVCPPATVYVVPDPASHHGAINWQDMESETFSSESVATAL